MKAKYGYKTTSKMLYAQITTNYYIHIVFTNYYCWNYAEMLIHCRVINDNVARMDYSTSSKSSLPLALCKTHVIYMDLILEKINTITHFIWKILKMLFHDLLHVTYEPNLQSFNFASLHYTVYSLPIYMEMLRFKSLFSEWPLY